MLFWFLLPACGAGKITLGADTGTAAFDSGTDADTDTDTDTVVDDTAPTDSGAHDTGPADTGPHDTGSHDTGSADTGATPPADCAAYGLLAADTLDLAYGSTTDAYDATLGAWSATNSSSDATVGVNATAACALSITGTLSGSGWVGPGGDTSTAVCIGYGGTVAGAVAAMSSVVAMPTVAAPAGMPASLGSVSKGWNETLTLDADTTVDDLTLGNASQLVIDRSLTLYVEGAFAADSTTLTIASGAVLDLYVGGGARVGWGTVLNGTGEPGALRLHLIGNGGLTLDYGGALTAVIEQPDGGFTNNGGVFSGTWIGRSATANWAATTHVDRSRACAR